MSETPALSIYESTFAKTDKTVAILVVQGKKLHVNKALLILPQIISIGLLLRMSRTLAIHIYENAFAKTDKTDAILVVDGKKLHVNKTVLSYHSDYFNTLFNSDFKEKSMPEIEIKDVDYEYFAILLCFFHGNTMKPNYLVAEDILELYDRFLLPAVKPYLEEILINSCLNRFEKLRIAEKHDLKDLFKHGIEQITKDDRLYDIERYECYKNLSDASKVEVLTKMSNARDGR
ncbi:hypothetical protein B9Z55_026983 [Caenorhabditis nigoni]|uniref:BTB domain-containing protein n=1 Tax=Caenorhabditis nigoni TaxID=1611254 RepID=A0A2G5SIN8_9PELO|nr:hypothetical protein B9Z55_026983 [Caenorhabditis nigoni]